MEPVTTIVTVLAMAAAMKLKNNTEKNIKYAYRRNKVKYVYRRIKALIHIRYSKVDLEPLEKEPESEDIRKLRKPIFFSCAGLQVLNNLLM